MKTKGLTRRLVTRTAIPTIAVFLIALLILSLVLSSQVKTNMNEKLLLQAKTITQESAAFFDEHANLTEQYASDPIFIKYMTEIKNNPQWLDEHPMWPTIHDQLYNAYLLHEDTLVEFYIASYYVMDLASSTGDVMNKDYPGEVDVFHREWMVRPKDEGATILTAPYVDGQTGNVVCTIASPVYSIAGNFLGTAAIDFLLNDVRDVFANAQVGENGYAMAFLGDGTMFYHPNEEYLVTTEDGDYYNIQDFDFPQELVDAVLAGEAGTIINFTDDNGTKMVGVTELLGDTGWITVACMPVSEAYAMTTSTIAILAAIQLLALIVIILSIWLVAKKALLPVSQIAEQADNMANGRTIGELPVVNTIEDEVDVLVTSFAALVDNNNKQTEILHEIAKGNTEIDVEVRGEEDTLNIAMKQVVDTLNTLIEETNDMTQYAILGETSYRGDETKFVGGYQRIITGFNATLDAIMREVHILSDAVATLGRGETPDIVNDSQGDYTAIVDSLIACVNSVKNLVDDANSIAEAAKREDYSVRADLDKYQGEYRRAIEGINGTLELMADKKIWYETILDCLGTPLQVMDNDCNWTFVNYPLANHFIDRGLYEKPSAMEGHKAVFNGQDFSGVPELHAGKDSIFYELDGAIYNRTTSELVDENGLKRGYIGLFNDVTGIMRENEYTEKAIERLQANLNSLANGSFEYEENTLTADEYQKAAEERFKQIDVAVDAVANAVMALVREAREMSDAAVAGDLEKRIDETKHQGEYSLVAKGFNDTVEAILTPIKEVMAVLERVAGGDLQKTVEGNYQGGHNATKDALNTTIMRLRSVIDDISNVLTSIAGGDLTVNIDAQKYVGDFTAIHESMEIILDKFRNVMSNLCESSDQVANGSRQLAKASSALANGTTQQASAIQQLTATVNEIAIKTKNNAADAKEASTLANGVKASAERGDKQMKGMLVSMQEINESSANISKIIKVIDDIAFQTNILALNAAVEAARAGVHGKGFAVVADEVRNLAAKSAAAANETTALIEGSISKVETGTKIANETAEALGEIVEGIGKAAALVDRISDASSDQATGISEVNIGIEKVSQVVTANSATSEESAASSEELYGQADMLKRLVAEFKLGGQKGSAVNNNRALPSRTTSNDMPEITLDLDFEGSDKY